MATLTQYLGDSATHRLPLSFNGAPFDPTGCTLIFTLKADPADADQSAKVQKATGSGIVIEQAGSIWHALVSLVPQDTVSLVPGRLVFDIQAQRLEGGAVSTVSGGVLVMLRDVTRQTSVSIPIFTTEPTVNNGDMRQSVYDQDGDGKVDAAEQSDDAQAHIARTDNPHATTKAQVGLGNADNTADTDKPISTLQAAALALKANLASPVFSGQPAISGAAGTDRRLDFQTNGVARWQLSGADGAGESGSNAGSGLVLRARNDAGGAIDNVVTIARAAGGLFSINRPLAINGGATLQRILTASTTWDPASVLSGNSVNVVFTCTGAEPGDVAAASFSGLGTATFSVSAYVQASNTVRLVLVNNSGSAQDLPSGTARVVVFKV